MSTQKRKGDLGEAEVARFLQMRGYELLDRQWRCRQGELDLVARDPTGVICFVEVKLRGFSSIALPREFVDQRKQTRIRTAAVVYLSTRDLEASARFDVAEVYAEQANTLRIEYLENAFE